MNMTVIIEMSEARQLKFMKKYPCLNSITEIAESRAVRLTYLTTTSMEIEGRCVFVFDLIDEMNPSSIDITSMDDLL